VEAFTEQFLVEDLFLLDGRDEYFEELLQSGHHQVLSAHEVDDHLPDPRIRPKPLKRLLPPLLVVAVSV